MIKRKTRFLLLIGILLTITISSGFIELVLSPSPSVKPELSLINRKAIKSVKHGSKSN